jgi:dynactin-4
MGKRSRLSVLGGLGGSSRKRDHGVERKGNISKVGLEVEVLPDAVGVVEVSRVMTECGNWWLTLQADFEIRYTYRADEAAEGEEKGKEAFKIFTFWVRVNFGSVEGH